VGEMSLGENYERKITPIGSNISRFSSGTVVERKDLPYLTRSCTAKWTAFIKRLGLMVRYPDHLLNVTSTLSQVKSPSLHPGNEPQRTPQFLEAVVLRQNCATARIVIDVRCYTTSLICRSFQMHS
jgi:hypothetical protein